ncbi:polygalacturonase QRT3 [Telopea speciosissima]|uniref:polygalacturonase QRT3 n=1 Tax=Telopea speciosissima TaxID=54955 RepID=UPI001CC4A1DE|nr:polygalacturonase QRT3 [Telopea speciosissima]
MVIPSTRNAKPEVPIKALFLLLVFLFLLLIQEAKCKKIPPPQWTFTEQHDKFLNTIAVRSKAEVNSVAPGSISSVKMVDGRVFYPIGYGADPSGEKDSSDAILDAMKDAFQVGAGGSVLLPGVCDLGGVVIDFQGGNYSISKPIRFPAPSIGNVVVQGGTLRASEAFPGNRHLIELWSPNSEKNTDPNNVGIINYEDITFRDLLLDSSLRGGGIYINDSARIRIDNCFFIHFTTQGIRVDNGHETFISRSFLGQRSTVGGDKGEKFFSGTAIDLASNDNAVTDVAIFSAATGIILRGQANILTGVHCYNKATAFGGIGILVKLGGLSQTRIDNCYLDYNAIVMEDPVQVHVTNGFFLGDANIVLKSIKGQISGLNILNNMFTGDPKNMVPIVKLDGKFTDIDQVVIDQNNVNGMRLKTTVGKLTVAGKGSEWVADFSSMLVFPNRINHFQYTFYSRGKSGFMSHAITNISNNVVIVKSRKVVDGVVSVVVDQDAVKGEKNFIG